MHVELMSTDGTRNEREAHAAMRATVEGQGDVVVQPIIDEVARGGLKEPCKVAAAALIVILVGHRDRNWSCAHLAHKPCEPLAILANKGLLVEIE